MVYAVQLALMFTLNKVKIELRGVRSTSAPLNGRFQRSVLGRIES